MQRYRNIRTGQVVEDTDEESVFARSNQWELVDEAGSPPREPYGIAEGPGRDAGGQDDVDLAKLKRGELNALALGLGVEEPDKLANADAVREAIEAKQAENA